MKKAQKQQAEEKKAFVSHQVLFTGPIFSVEREEYQFPHGTHRTYDLVKHAQAVAVLPVDSHGNLLLIHQYRRAADTILLEIPAGLMEKGEEIEKSAQRELQEEIGYYANTLIPIGSFYTSPGFCDELVHIFIAKDLVESKLPHDEHEAIDLAIISPAAALLLIQQGKIRDMKTHLALAHYFQTS